MLGGQISTTFDLRSGHVQECFLQEKRDIFDETLGQFPAVCDETKPGVFLPDLWAISSRVHGNKTWCFVQDLQTI